MIYFYLFSSLFLASAFFDILVRRFLLLPIALGSIGAIFLLLIGQPITVMLTAFFGIALLFYWILFVNRKKS